MANVLAIVEGEKNDVQLMQRLFDIYFSDSPKDYVIWSYKTNIYELYDKVFKDNDEENIDLMTQLRSRETDIQKKEIFDQDYTDVILIFDLDPHDSRYDKDKLLRMQNYFNESTENGKLYLNYPMLEAFKHTKTRNGSPSGYLSLEVRREMLKQYKKQVNDEALHTDYKSYDKKLCDEIIKLNIEKAFYIQTQGNMGDIKNDYSHIDLLEIVKKQCGYLNENNKIYILCTCIFYISDYGLHFIDF